MIGASIGIAIAPQDGHDTDHLLAAADQALYVAKRAGKNGWRRHQRGPSDELQQDARSAWPSAGRPH